MHYWIFKSEPDEFGINDLRRVESEPWGGIRNFQARNFLRDHVAKGDRVFIYHSRCKDIGIVGIAEVVSDTYPDPSQFLATSDYFDPKSSVAAPKWFCVDIAFVEKFARTISLDTLKATSGLENMVLLKQGRLSIQPVAEHERDIILTLAGTRERKPK